MNCLITGASIGIGRSLALKLASLGYNLLLTYNTNEIKCQELQSYIISEYNVKCIIQKCDLRNEEDIKNVFNKFREEFQGLDVLVNNASISHDNLIEDKSKEEFMDVLEVNLVGTFLMSKYFSNIMSSEGIIVNMASTDGIDTESLYNIDYSASKAGIISITKSFSLSYQKFRTVALAPNWVDTESTIEMNQDYLKEELKRIGQTKLISKDLVVEKIIHIIVDKNIESGSIIRIDGDKDE